VLGDRMGLARFENAAGRRSDRIRPILIRRGRDGQAGGDPMTRRRGAAVGVVAVAALLVGRAAFAGPPTDQLRAHVDRVVKTLEDPALKGDDKVLERRRQVRGIANDIFDWAETARRALARHWQTLTDGQREEFVKLFGDLLERAYISKIELYGGEKIQYAGESIDGDLASVRTKLITKQGTEVPIEYRMMRRGDRWLVYDVVIENVSLISNYRTQFNRIIQTSSYKELVRKMKTKQEEFESEEAKQKRGTS
jgi:phospholipid transport system substrate-binding protein